MSAFPANTDIDLQGLYGHAFRTLNGTRGKKTAGWGLYDGVEPLKTHIYESVAAVYTHDAMYITAHDGHIACGYDAFLAGNATLARVDEHVTPDAGIAPLARLECSIPLTEYMKIVHLPDTMAALHGADRTVSFSSLTPTDVLCSLDVRKGTDKNQITRVGGACYALFTRSHGMCGGE